jgi:NAD(P)-dependent dehydrogenase (short-subunit alcohol dehydrogenase family)
MSGAPAVVVTGSSGGIGRALCDAFKTDGLYVIGIDKVVKGDRSNVFLKIDLARLSSEPDYLRRSLRTIRSAIGKRPLHALVNNAAVQLVKRVEALNAADWYATLDVNLLAPFLLTKELLSLLERNAGSVVNIGSIHAKLTKPKFTSYASSKAALEGLTKSLAVELGGRIRVNAIAPAAVSTSMLRAGFTGKASLLRKLENNHPARRIARPEEIASAARYLASDQAGFITGSVMEVHGGIGARLHDPL